MVCEKSGLLQHDILYVPTSNEMGPGWYLSTVLYIIALVVMVLALFKAEKFIKVVIFKNIQWGPKVWDFKK